jgi:cytochrome c biogenesis protein CcdA/thiol-disulfide isomerase/thioredoxin
MAVLIAFAFLSGVVTVLSPCILPVLPIVLAGSVGRGKARPLGVVVGFVVTFVTFTLALTAIVHALGLPPDTLRFIAVALLVLLGVVMIVPKLRDRFEMLVSRASGRVSIGSGRGAGGRRGSAGGPAPEGSAPGGLATPATAPGFWRGLPVGFSLGAVWAPCVGPIMASVISLALTRTVTGQAVVITAAYTIGTAIPMTAVMLGGRALLNRVPGLTRNMARIQRGFGVVMILIGVAIGFGWDRQFQNAVLRAFPNYGSGLTAFENRAPVRNALKAIRGPEGSTGGSATSTGFPASYKEGVLGDYGMAPAVVAKGPWFNTGGILPEGGNRSGSAGGSDTAGGGSPPLTMADLSGKVVLIDFWTYSCVNCVRTIPYLRTWYEEYRDKGLVIIGVHTPEFEFEKKTANVARAIRELGVTWPVVQDNDYAQWRAYDNHYWPAHYLIDAAGHVRYVHFGEGSYDATDRVIRTLLREAGATLGRPVAQAKPRFTSQTPETYLGTARSTGFISEAEPQVGRGESQIGQAAQYRATRAPGNGEWSLSGSWIITPGYVQSVDSSSQSELKLGFDASNVYLVVQPEEPGSVIEVRLDGHVPEDTADVTGGVLSPRESRLYQLVGLPRPGEHVLDLKVKGKLRLFAFTFG